ncbi:hypothetical protein GCM10007876_16660 [Litoribrevibacter albus]|uniref:Uncharacterized protein n=1 Tax=Litoribrevibacter albus TaxID=1473156 RepID=A0AA37SAK7_9GAMM|nr:hypothetical protein GCM10007876_16660 [Litoribrevibacter albus]
MPDKRKLLTLLSARNLPDHVIFQRFVCAVFIFACGALLIFYAESKIEPSLRQEIIALVGLILACAGGAYAFIHYLALIFSRLRGK